MQHIKQNDYDNFVCMAGQCPMSCCCGWQIVIDDESLNRYKELPQIDSDSKIDFKESVFLQNNRRCSMLTDENLCRLQLKYGHDMLCYTCQNFPRHVEEFDGVREYSLSLSCPKVAMDICQRISPIIFIEGEDDKEDEDDFEEFDFFLYTKLLDARELIYKIAQNRMLTVRERVGRILYLARKIQECLDQDRLCDIDDLIVEFQPDAMMKLQSDESETFAFKASNISILYELEHLDSDFTDYIDAGFSYEKNLVKQSGKFFDDLSQQESLIAEHILVLLIYTYFCGAVYDDMVYSKAALAVFMLQWIFSIYKALADDCDLDLLAKVIYTVSREIEHSDPNLNFLDEYFGRKE